MAVVHAHAEAVLPFTITPRRRLRPVIHSGSFMGADVPVWEQSPIVFGDTNLLVTKHGPGPGPGALPRPQQRGADARARFAAAARRSSRSCDVRVYTPRNARALLAALALGEVKPLSRGGDRRPATRGTTVLARRPSRAWEYWARRAGCGGMLD